MQLQSHNSTRAVNTARRLRVFLASPGDVGEERAIAREILSQLPYDALIDWKVAFEVVAWDQPGSGPPMLATMTPQAAIDAGLPRPSDCDIVVVILWSRMGTPLPGSVRKPDGTPYRSGTEWEYLDAYLASQHRGKPMLLVYRRMPPCPLDEADPQYGERLAQRQQVEAFFAEFRNPDGSTRGFNEYSDPAHFRRMFEQHFRTIVAHELARPAGNDERGVGTDAAAKPMASTTTAIFVGPTLRGPTRPELVVGWEDFVRTFGEGLPSDVSFLAHAVRGYFDNGGGRCYVVRVLGAGATAAGQYLAIGDGTLGFVADSPGNWGNRLGVLLRAGTRRGLRLTVVEQALDNAGVDRELEDWDNLGLDPAGPNPLAEVVNEGPRRSRWLRCTSVPTRLEAVSDGGVKWLAGGSDGAPPTAEDFCGEWPPAPSTGGLWSTEPFEDAVLLCVPDQVHEGIAAEVRQLVAQEAVAQCERVLHRFALLSVERGQGDAAAVQAGCDSASAALFAPWVCVDEIGRLGVAWVPAVGHVAGILARTDFERGIHHAPLHEALRGLARDDEGRSVEFAFDASGVDTLVRLGVNALGRDEGDEAVRMLTAVTSSSDERYSSLAAARLVRFIVASIEMGTRWAVFEANDQALWRKLTEEISAFLESVWSSGGLLGRTPEEAFFVRCDRSTMTQDDIDNGRAICEIGLAFREPAAWPPPRITIRTAAPTGAARGVASTDGTN